MQGHDNILFFTEWINMQKLSILGVHKEHVYVVLFMVSIVALYTILRPVILFLLLKRSHKLLTYIISSLLMLVVLLFTFLRREGSGSSFAPFTKHALLTFAIFGIVLIVMNVFHFFLQKKP